MNKVERPKNPIPSDVIPKEEFGKEMDKYRYYEFGNKYVKRIRIEKLSPEQKEAYKKYLIQKEKYMEYKTYAKAQKVEQRAERKIKRDKQKELEAEREKIRKEKMELREQIKSINNKIKGL